VCSYQRSILECLDLLVSIYQEGHQRRDSPVITLLEGGIHFLGEGPTVSERVLTVLLPSPGGRGFEARSPSEQTLHKRVRPF
jgi:hypothetical protein